MWDIKAKGRKGVKDERDAARQLVDLRWKHQDLEELDTSSNEPSATKRSPHYRVGLMESPPSTVRRSRSRASSVSDLDLEEGRVDGRGAGGHKSRRSENCEHGQESDRDGGWNSSAT